MRITNNANLPEAIVRAVTYDDYDYEDAGDISASGLIKPPRMRWLEKRHDDEIVVDAADLIWRMIGSIGHKILERAADPNTLYEERLTTTVLGWVVTGKFDVLHEKNGLGIDDFKFTSVWAVKDEKKDWTAQLNVYAWLAKLFGFDIERLRITAVLRDHSKPKAAKEPDYPQVQVVVREVPLWSVEKQEQYITDRVQFHRVTEILPDNYLPDCTDNERWARPDTFAVLKKKGAKRAVRVLPTHEDALEWAFDRKLDDYHIEHRPGNKTVRCDHYCDVKKFCNQYAALKGLLP
jgi:hypothetical protein